MAPFTGCEYWFVRNLLSSYVKPCSRLAQKLRGLIWLKFALRTYSLKPEATQLMARSSATAQPRLREAPQASRGRGGCSTPGTPPGNPSSGCQRTPSRAPPVLLEPAFRSEEPPPELQPLTQILCP